MTSGSGGDEGGVITLSNDEPGRTQREVLEVMDAAIARLRT
jgi:hypothetical protein